MLFWDMPSTVIDQNAPLVHGKPCEFNALAQRGASPKSINASIVPYDPTSMGFWDFAECLRAIETGDLDLARASPHRPIVQYNSRRTAIAAFKADGRAGGVARDSLAANFTGDTALDEGLMASLNVIANKAGLAEELKHDKIAELIMAWFFTRHTAWMQQHFIGRAMSNARTGDQLCVSLRT